MSSILQTNDLFVKWGGKVQFIDSNLVLIKSKNKKFVNDHIFLTIHEFYLQHVYFLCFD